MKRRLISLLIFLVTLSSLSAEEYYQIAPIGKFHFISHNFGPYLLSGKTFSEFKIFRNDQVVSQVHILKGAKQALGFCPAYQLESDAKILATHYVYFYSPGAISHWMKSYVVYDNQENYLGYIQRMDSYLNSTKFELGYAPAEFHFFDVDSNYFAKAILNAPKNKLVLFDTEDQILLEADKVFNVSYFLSKYNTYHWNIKKFSEDDIDERFFWPFMAYVGDSWWWKK